MTGIGERRGPRVRMAAAYITHDSPSNDAKEQVPSGRQLLGRESDAVSANSQGVAGACLKLDLG